MSSSSRSDRVRTLRDSGQRGDVEALADLLGELARAVVGRYRGDLRRLRSAARRDRPGSDDRVADLFLREVQALWGEVAPVATGGP